MPQLFLSADEEADSLLSENPLALLIGMVLDQQISIERAFSSPRDLRDRLGGQLEAGYIAAMGPAMLTALFAEKPALHRFPASNAERVQKLCQLVEREYGGEASRIWAGATSGTELLKRVRELPGFGDQKAKIFVALLGKQFGVQPPGWRDASRPFGDPGTRLSVADITDAESLSQVRANKAQLRASTKAPRGAPKS
jgi:uncharacterized HhH-GPD family protein